MYPRPLGDTTPAPSSGGFDINNLLNTILNDVTQIIKPGTPQIRPVYTAGSTATTSILNSPVVLIGGAALLYLLLSKRR